MPVFPGMRHRVLPGRKQAGYRASLGFHRLLRQTDGQIRASARDLFELCTQRLPFFCGCDAHLAQGKTVSEKHAQARTFGDGACKTSALPPLLFAEHHQSHAASAFFFSPFDKAAVLCLDGVGEWATTSAWGRAGKGLTPLWEIDFPHSLGLLYSAFTYFTGFRVNSGEYKLMGLAPYGTPRYRDLILDKLLDLKEDGTFRLDMQYFNYCTGLTMTNSRFDELFGGPPRKPESKLTQREMDIAASIQVVTEEVVLRLARTLHRETGMPTCAWPAALH